ncbi:Ribokinase-like protein [Dothidotthia symphoricarpi CBS 119687]|uniref:Adenosine kinase n=1 Tax=Dothidotthia symphoricarpi CBS 119687 TaxID=1392245 RepID=A0A6A5ZX48_9PLEO|nr:Ribokinase-like protein [Dothidotthia symphoricarpi CBS 119687]KAF2123473.1 Ribokinase-like protein [Dothidotthia symphoricarpi CBS 119687]
MAAKGNFELLCLENPLLDIQGVADQKLLDKYDLKANDAILAEEKHMGLYEDLLQNYKAVLIAGGAAQNTARGAQYMLQPDSVVYIGCIGKDKYGETLEKISGEAGVKTEYLYDEKTPTGRCGVVITGHNRSLCTDLAAANNYKVEHLKSERIWKQVENAQVFYVGGFHLTVCVPAIKALAEEAASKNKTFILNLSAPFISQFFKDPLDEVLPYVDILIGNETEAAAFAESHGIESKDVKEIAKAIANMPKKNSKRARTVVFTQGTDPTVAVSAKDGGDVDVKEVAVHAIGDEKINDTNGAGDAFAGGFVAGIVEGKGLEQSIDMGQWLAKLSIQELGPSYPSPKQTYKSS